MKPAKAIRHIVLSGGGETGFMFYGALRESYKTGFWDLKNIQTIHSTSAGSIFGTVLPLIHRMSWEDYDDLMYNRPWDKVFAINLETIVESYEQGGILGKKTIHDAFYPVFSALQLPMNITLEKYYEFTGIEIHYFTTNFTKFELVDVSYKTHPDWEVIDAIYCSCALPILFRPNMVQENAYIDGAVFCNFPIQQCLDICDDPDTILAFQKICPGREERAPFRGSNLFDYLFTLLGNLLENVAMDSKLRASHVKHCVKFHQQTTNVYLVYQSTSNYEVRKGLIDRGAEIWHEFASALEPESES